MGFFTKPDGAGAFGSEVPTPVTLARVQAAIESMEYQVGQEDEYLWGFWDGRYFDFRVFGEGQVLQLRGVWSGLPVEDDRGALVAAANDWNADRLFPKAFVLTGEDGEVTVLGEVNIPAGEGLSDAQLVDLVSATLSTGEEFFGSLDERFPAAARRREEQREAAEARSATDGQLVDGGERP